MNRMPVLLLFLLALCVTLQAGELVPAFGPDDIDLAHCQAFIGEDQQAPPTLEALAVALCGTQGQATWSTAASLERERCFVVGFKAPVAFGTVCAPAYPGAAKVPLRKPAGFFVSILKVDAPYPGDPHDETQWALLRPGAVKYLPPGTETRALRFSEIHTGHFRGGKPQPSSLARVLCLRGRYYDATDLGSVTRRRPDEQSEVIFASWVETAPLAGLFFPGPSAKEASFALLDAACTLPATHAPETMWRAVSNATRVAVDALFLSPAVPTRAVRIACPFAGRQTGLPAVVPLVALGERDMSPGLHRPAPYKVEYEMPLSGFAALDIHDKETGTLVRRLIGETAREKGAVQEPWDLRDEEGQIVQPGAYTWRALAVPPLKRTYELTLYNAGIPAWRAPPPHGKGGGMWLADHAPPQCAAAQGERMWLGTGCTEDGHCWIATDLDGTKLWGSRHISEGFRGPSRIAVDARCAYGITNTLIYRVDPERDFLGRSIYAIHSTAERPWSVEQGEPRPDQGGLAARDGRLYVAINEPERWLKSSFIADTMNPARCEPSVRLYKNGGRKRENEKIDKVYGFGRYDELMSFYAAFLCDRMPAETLSYPNVPLTCNGEAIFGPAPTDGKNRGRLVAVFREPVTVGAIVVPDGATKVQVLKAGVALDRAVTTDAQAASGSAGMASGGGVEDNALTDMIEDLEDDMGASGPGEGIWVTLEDAGPAGQPGVALAPPGGLKTRAIRYRAERLPFTQVLGRRLRNVAPLAERLFTEGDLTPQGGVWVTRRDGAVTPFQPAVMALRWPAAHTLRGVGLVRVGAGEHRPRLPSTVAVDRWIGEGAPDAETLAQKRGWEAIRTFALPNDVTLYQADFGRTVATTTIRIRCLDGHTPQQSTGVQVAGFHGILAYEPVGDDPADLPANMSQRIAVLELPAPEDDEGMARVVDDIPLPKPDGLAFDGEGVLHCMSEGQIITVPLEREEERRVVVPRERLDKPVQFCFGPKGLIYVTDNGPKVVKVFDPQTGELVQSLGTPGGTTVGPWDPLRLVNPAQVAVDRDGKVWVADRTYTPKRVMVFNPDGSAHKWFLGPTQYGGGGSMDPGDRSIVMYNGMKFRIDWESRTWKLEALLGHNVERCIYRQGKRYVVGPFPGPKGLTQVTFERGGVATPIAVAGRLADWQAFAESPELQQAFGDQDPEATAVLWSDRSGDEAPQPEEIQLVHGLGTKQSWDVGEDLTLFTLPVYGRDGIAWRPTGFTPQGVPVYDVEQRLTIKPQPLPRQTRRAWCDDQGRFFLIGARLLAADGETKLWEYPNPFTQHAGFYNTPWGRQRPPGKLSQEHFPIAHFTVGKEEFYVVNTDPGDWYCYTADGMMAACLFGGPRGYGLKTWPAEWEKGKTVLDDLRLGQEHYQGCVVKADDGKVYAIAGHNHMSVVRIEGLERLARFSGAVSVTPTDLEQTAAWQAHEDWLRQIRTTPKVATMLRASYRPAISATLEEWPEEVFVTVAMTVQPGLNEDITYLDSKGAVAYDEDHLYLALMVRDESPLKNNAQDMKTLFKGGDAADFTLGFDAAADPKRQGAVPGDVRLLFSLVKGKPVAVLYKPVDPNAPAAAQTRFVSPVGQVFMDRVAVLDEAKVAFKTSRLKQLKDGITLEGNFWTMEAAVPWSSLGVAPPVPGTTLRGDFGYLQSDEHGTATAGRVYWAGKSQTVISDTPSEARLRPALWGEIVVTKPTRSLRFLKPIRTDGAGLLEEEGVSEGAILEELEGLE